MKVIDLLNKIANREELPKKISYENKIYIYYEAYVGYYEEGSLGIYNKKFLSFRNEQWHSVLNTDIEIIEEDKEIEEIVINSSDKYLKTNADMPYYSDFGKSDVLLATKINELIREFNKMRKEGK